LRGGCIVGQEQAQRKALGGVNATQEIDQQVNRQIKVLEARLDKALVKFNEALSHNKDLRLEIDHLRKERYAVAPVRAAYMLTSIEG
jgi:predicted component of type VI protein secretion system